MRKVKILKIECENCELRGSWNESEAKSRLVTVLQWQNRWHRTKLTQWKIRLRCSRFNGHRSDLTSFIVNDWDARFSNDSEQSRVVEHGEHCVDDDNSHDNNTADRHARGYDLRCGSSVVHNRIQVRSSP